MLGATLQWTTILSKSAPSHHLMLQKPVKGLAEWAVWPDEDLTFITKGKSGIFSPSVDWFQVTACPDQPHDQHMVQELT